MKQDIVKLCKINCWIIREAPIQSALTVMFRSGASISKINVCELFSTLARGWFIVIMCSIATFSFTFSITKTIMVIHKSRVIMDILFNDIDLMRSLTLILAFFIIISVLSFLLVNIFLLCIKLMNMTSLAYYSIMRYFNITLPNSLFSVYARSIKNRLCTSLVIQFKNMDSKKS